MNVHHKCQKKVANLCGVNQKLMAEALAIIESKQQVRPANLLLFQNVSGPNQTECVFFQVRGVFFPIVFYGQ